ncbi:lipopolysaccharide biosynthesis protein [Idiomarina sp. ST20R2A10]|uniref:lipopolysaccharide biosynthesis protein n=1 Tax=Idiomarina sp. ST20R2A10 TaxID=3418369 RepID=UPI003EC8681E
MSLKEKAMRGLFWSLADKIFNRLGFLAVTLYIAKEIGPEAFGLVGMLTIFILIADSAVNNGFSQALVQRSNSLTEADTSTTFYINLLWGLVIYLILYFSAPLISEFYNEQRLVDISRVLFLIIVINSLSVVVRAKLLIKVDFKTQTLASFISVVLSSICAIALTAKDYGYWAYVSLLLLNSIFLTLTLWFFVRWHPKFIFNKSSFKKIFSFGSNLMLAGFISTLSNNLYIVIVGRYFNSSSVGYFNQANNLTNFLHTLVSSTVQNVTYPLLTSLKEEQERLLQFYRQLISFTAYVSLPVFLGFSVISDTFVLLFLGEAWLPVSPILQILCFAKAVLPITALNMNIINAIGRSDLFLKVDIIKFPLTLAGLFIGVNFGLKGVAMAVLIVSIISYFINSYFPGKVIGIGAVQQFKLIQKYLYSSLAMVVIVSFIKIDALWLDLIFSIVSGACVYILILFFMKDNVTRLMFYEVKRKFKSGI